MCIYEVFKDLIVATAYVIMKERETQMIIVDVQTFHFQMWTIWDIICYINK